MFIVKASTQLVEKYLPDAFAIVLILTLAVFGAGLAFESKTPMEMTSAWGNGFWGLLPFTMQMVLVLVTGYVLAQASIIKKALAFLASKATSPRSAIVIVTVVSLVASWLNWGFGLVIGALFAKELARKIPSVNYPLLIASAYSGFVIWHGGLSGSVPLTIATSGHFTENLIGVVPTSETIFSTYNLGIVLALIILIPITNYLMSKTPGISINSNLIQEEAEIQEKVERAADKIETSAILTRLFGFLGLGYFMIYTHENGWNLNLNILNFGFLSLALIFHKSLRSFLRSVEEAARASAGIIIQFPFYAGIMGMMIESGLAKDLSELFVSFSSQTTLPLFTFWSAGILNIFIPSGGGQWAVQSQVMLPAAMELNADLTKTAMAVAWGDAWTNMIQPFWALPALGIAGLKAKDIMGYCLIILAVSGIVISVGFLI